MKLLIQIFLVPLYLTAQPKSEIVIGDASHKIDAYLTQLAKDKSYSGGLLILKGNEIIFSKGYGWANKEEKIPFASNTLASVGSITKAFTSAAILKLYQQKKLSLKDPLKKFFPNIPTDKQAITIHQLLTHSAGFVEFLPGDQGDYEKVDTELFLSRCFAQPLAFVPRTKAIYSNIGMSVLGVIIEKVSGLEYEAYLKKELFLPNDIHIGYHFPKSTNMNIAHGYQSGKDWGTIPGHFEKAGGGPYWNLKANGGLEASLEDIAKWSIAMSNKTILPDSLVIKMFSAQVQEEGYEGNSFFGYGCNISKSKRGTKMIDNGGSNGIYHARMIRLPEEGLIFYMVTNENSINTNQVLPNVTQLYFDGRISTDFTATKFNHPMMNKLYSILTEKDPSSFELNIKEQNIVVDDDMILYEVGQKLINENKTKEAIALYKYYTSSFPKIVVAWNDLGEIYLNQGNSIEAKKCFEAALQLRPGNPRAIENLKKIK